MQNAVVQQRPISAKRFGLLNAFAGNLDDSAVVKRAFDKDGYVFLRGVLDRNEVLAARSEVFRRLQDVGEVAAPAIDDIATGASRRAEMAGDLGRFWQSVSEGTGLRCVTHGPVLRNIMSQVLGELARPHDLMYLR